MNYLHSCIMLNKILSSENSEFSLPKTQRRNFTCNMKKPH